MALPIVKNETDEAFVYLCYEFMTQLGGLYGVALARENLPEVYGSVNQCKQSVVNDLGTIYGLIHNPVQLSPAGSLLQTFRLLVDRLGRLQIRLNQWTPGLRWCNVLLACERSWERILEGLADETLMNLFATSVERRGLLAMVKNEIYFAGKNLDENYAQPTAL